MAAPWPSDWLRGTLELATLRALADGPTYGYAVAVALEEAGFGSVKGGTLYPLLGRLEAAALVATEWRAGEGGPGRKYYSLTDTGRAELARQREQWQAFTHTVGEFLDPSGGGTTADPSTQHRGIPKGRTQR